MPQRAGAASAGAVLWRLHILAAESAFGRSGALLAESCGVKVADNAGAGTWCGGGKRRGEYREQRLHLSAAETAELSAVARRHQLTLNTVVQGAWSILLSRYSGEREVVFGTTVAGRPAELRGVEQMVGRVYQHPADAGADQ